MIWKFRKRFRYRSNNCKLINNNYFTLFRIGVVVHDFVDLLLLDDAVAPAPAVVSSSKVLFLFLVIFERGLSLLYKSKLWKLNFNFDISAIDDAAVVGVVVSLLLVCSIFVAVSNEVKSRLFFYMKII